jgi:hypothetical protein
VLNADMAIISTLKAHERHLSAAAMIGGFALDNFAFERIDHPATEAVLASYLLIAAGTIAILHYFEERAEQSNIRFRWSAVISGLTQFSFGGLWSAFLIFYSRSAVIETAWPFLLILVLIFLGNEIFREYRSRLVFTSILLFFAIFSCCTFIVPIFTGTIDHRTFLLSGALAIFAFIIFLALLALLTRSRIRRDLGKITLGAIAIFGGLNLFYYMNVLPPLPLALVDSGMYYSRSDVDQKYRGANHFQPWYRKLKRVSKFQLSAGQPLYAYSAVFAPVRLTTQIVHEWEWFNPETKSWKTETVITFPILGGREFGYRGYSFKAHLRTGAWRVDVETKEGRIIERMHFDIE